MRVPAPTHPCVYAGKEPVLTRASAFSFHLHRDDVSRAGADSFRLQVGHYLLLPIITPLRYGRPRWAMGVGGSSRLYFIRFRIIFYFIDQFNGWITPPNCQPTWQWLYFFSRTPRSLLFGSFSCLVSTVTTTNTTMTTPMTHTNNECTLGYCYKEYRNRGSSRPNWE